MRTEEEEGLKLADQSHCLFVCLFVCFSWFMCVSVSRHEEEEGLKPAEGRLRGDHKPDSLHPDHCPAESLIFFDKLW